MFHMSQAGPSVFVSVVPGLLFWATYPVAAIQAVNVSQQCPAGDEIGFLQTHVHAHEPVNAHKIPHAEPSDASEVSTHSVGSTESWITTEVRDALVELNNSNINRDIPGFGGIVKDTICIKASVLAKPAIAKCSNTLAKISSYVDELLNGTLEASQAFADVNGNTSMAARLEKFENYSNRVLGLGVQQWQNMYDMFNLIAPMATQALQEAGMHSLAHSLRLDTVNKTLRDVLHFYQTAQLLVHGIGNKSVNEVGFQLGRLNETMKTGLNGVDAFAQALNKSFVNLTDGLAKGMKSLLPKSCSFWRQPLENTGLTLANIIFKVRDSVHRLASDLVQAGEQLGIQLHSPTVKSAKSAKSGCFRFMLSRPVTLSVMAVVAAFARFPA